jgi:p-hydroxybenzoate 3-monooxygenase
LGQLLHRAGIDNIILERQTRDYVQGRIRAGVLEWGSVETLRRSGVGARMDAEGQVHDGIWLADTNRMFRVSLKERTGKSVMVYGQTEITADLYQARDAAGLQTIHEALGVAIRDSDTDAPFVTYTVGDTSHRIDCDFIAGCDGFYGVARKTMPEDVLRTYERVYPYGWLGVLSETAPASEEVLYAHHPNGFSLCSMRNTELSRYYIQVSDGDSVENWSDDAFWAELRTRLPGEIAENLITGPSVEKSIARLRSFVAEPMRWGRLFLVGDAAHIVPPTGAKGLNLAISDVHYLSEGLIARYDGSGDDGIESYSDRALARVWGATRFSWAFTQAMHPFPGQSDFDGRMQAADLAYLEHSETAQTALAESYIGLPY